MPFFIRRFRGIYAARKAMVLRARVQTVSMLLVTSRPRMIPLPSMVILPVQVFLS